MSDEESTVLTVTDLSEDEKTDILTLIYELILKGNSRPVILATFLKQKSLEIPELYDEAVEIFAREGFIDKYAIAGFCLTAKKELYRKLNGAGDYPGALRALESFEKTAASLTATPGKKTKSPNKIATPLNAEIDAILLDDE